jgi:rare lipoprotein A
VNRISQVLKSLIQTATCRLALLLLFLFAISTASAATPATGRASWYGERHRGRLMANGQRFDPDKLTAASWFYPLGARVRVSLNQEPSREVLVTITDRGPARRFVRNGRIIDLTHEAFRKLAAPDIGLVAVKVEPVQEDSTKSTGLLAKN